MPPLDGDLVPHLERPEPRTRLQERLEGQQISRLYYLDEVGPTGSRGLAFELTNGAKLIIWAARDRFGVYSARLVLRWMDVPRIILPRMARAFSGGRDRDPEAGPPDELQRLIEGEVIKGVIHHREPTKAGGEFVEFELSDRRRLGLMARPYEHTLPGGHRMLADIEWAVSEPERSKIVMP